MNVMIIGLIINYTLSSTPSIFLRIPNSEIIYIKNIICIILLIAIITTKIKLIIKLQKVLKIDKIVKY